MDELVEYYILEVEIRLRFKMSNTDKKSHSKDGLNAAQRGW